MISLSIITDFCSWWPLWWIAPFLLGLLLGRSLWGKFKRKVADLENEVARHKSQNHNLNSALKQCKAKGENDHIVISDQKKELLEARKKFALLETKAETTSKLSSSVPVIPVDTSSSGKAADVSKKGNYDFLNRNNLQILEGIGPKLESVLKENGIKNWADLSIRSYGELRAILDKYGGRYAIVDPTSWPKQASLAKREKWDKLIQLQSEGGSESKLKKILLKLEIL